jgi:hypothetical protein
MNHCLKPWPTGIKPGLRGQDQEVAEHTVTVAVALPTVIVETCVSIEVSVTCKQSVRVSKFLRMSIVSGKLRSSLEIRNPARPRPEGSSRAEAEQVPVPQTVRAPASTPGHRGRLFCCLQAAGSKFPSQDQQR